MKKLLAAFAVLILASTSMAATYTPVGPQNNVLFSTVTGGGWTPCFSQAYGAFGPSLSTITTDCSGRYIMLAGAANGSDTIQLLAFAERSVVFSVTPDCSNQTNVGNGAQWYFNNSCSMGFAPIGFAISQNSADTNSAPGFGSAGDDGTQRLSWHTGGGQMNGGWRVGNNTFLNGEPSGFTKYIFQTDTLVGVPAPESLTLAGLALMLAAGALARRK